MITDKGYKWYPSGVVTTPKDEVFPTRATNYPNLTKILSEKDGFVNVKLSQKDLPSNFYFRSDGALVAPIGSSMIACLASKNNVPVVAVCETYKFADRVNLDQINNNE